MDMRDLDLEDTKRNETRESTSKQRTAKEDRNTEAKFATLVKECQIKYRTSKEAGFKSTVSCQSKFILNIQRLS